jgi:hypothetical protein
MTVGNKDVAVWGNRDSGRTIECVWTIAGNAFLAERHQDFALRTKFEDLLAHNHAVGILGRHAEHYRLVVHVAGPQISVRIDREAMGIGEQPDTETLQQLT